jgi:hypothetical protein
MIQFRIHGAQQVAQGIAQSATAIAADFRTHLRTKAPQWAILLRATIQHVVYDPVVGRVKHYRHTMNLLKGVGHRVDEPSPEITVAVMGDIVSVPLRGGNVSAGGSPRGEAPFEIEEGRMPAGWQGPVTGPRPAYQMTTDAIRPDVYAAADAIVTKHIP